ncbi:MAG: diacylglycerol kinase family protein [Verrucomicrobiota bacterium]
MNRVRVLINARSVLWWSGGAVQQALNQYWDQPGTDLTYQFSKSAEDGQRKARQAMAEGVETILVVGGDGMVNSIGAALVGSRVALGVVPGGSGNGFARHFGIPLSPEKAVQALLGADRRVIDIGLVNGRAFLVTCSLAWDAALLRTFEKFPLRGVLSYVVAAATELLGYVPQPFEVELDGGKKMTFSDPVVFTAANLTQYGGGAQIAPQACPHDEMLELVVISSQDVPRLLASVNRLFDGTFDELPGVFTRKFRRMWVHRTAAAPIQVDGELIEPTQDVTIEVLPQALTVLVPRGIA